MDPSIAVGVYRPPSASVISTVFQPFMNCTKTWFVQEILLVYPYNVNCSWYSYRSTTFSVNFLSQEWKYLFSLAQIFLLFEKHLRRAKISQTCGCTQSWLLTLTVTWLIATVLHPWLFAWQGWALWAAGEQMLGGGAAAALWGWLPLCCWSLAFQNVAVLPWDDVESCLTPEMGMIMEKLPEVEQKMSM